MSDWLSKIKNAKKSCIVQGNLRKVHYDFEDGGEMVEEYNMDTNVLTRRAWKIKTKVGGDGDWDIEIGDPEPSCTKQENVVIKESSTEPFITRRITKLNLEWRIRNLPYPIETYSVTADPENKCLIVRTTNKKYFKKLSIPELDHANVKPIQDNISFSHKYNTLIITYKKPKEVIELEKAVFNEIKTLQAKNAEDLNCKPS